MLLTIATTHRPATDLGYLLHKHPDRCQTFALSFGQAHVLYSEVGDERCTACLLLDVDPVGMVRGRSEWKDGLLDQYVNDRPYVASSLMSVAIAQVFGSALAGRSKERVELVDVPIPSRNAGARNCWSRSSSCSVPGIGAKRRRRRVGHGPPRRPAARCWRPSAVRRRGAKPRTSPSGFALTAIRTSRFWNCPTSSRRTTRWSCGSASWRRTAS
ncbi:MAG: hypothetical protein KF847_06815 [Pirellulales bacterium]|nr:hypothetical protein [Pirellulales bacterium]